MYCPICGKTNINYFAISAHLKIHKIKLKELIENDYNFKLIYEKEKQENLSLIKEKSPYCIEFYNKHYPELTGEERKKLLENKKKTSVKNGIESNKKRLEKMKSEMTEEEFKQFFIDKAKEDKEKCLKKYMEKYNISYEEANEKFRQIRVDISPATDTYWLNKGYSKEDLGIIKKKFFAKSSKSCLEYWLKQGYSEEYARKCLAIHQSFNSNKFNFLKDFGYTREEIENLRDIFKKSFLSEVYIDEIIDTIKNKKAKYKYYYEMVWFFTLQSKDKIEGIELRSKDYHIDHIYSIKEGFENNISPEIIGSIVNLRMLTKIENSKKGKRCDMTKEELLEKFKTLKQKDNNENTNDL